MRRPLFLLAALLSLAACHQKDAEKPQIRDAWVRMAAVPGRPAAGYFTVKGGAADDRLVRIDSAVVKRIEMHDNMAVESLDGAVMAMRPIANLPVAAGTKIEFAPGGKHAMLFDIDPAITPGTEIPMLFTFASGYKIQAGAKSVPAGGDDMAGMHH